MWHGPYWLIVLHHFTHSAWAANTPTPPFFSGCILILLFLSRWWSPVLLPLGCGWCTFSLRRCWNGPVWLILAVCCGAECCMAPHYHAAKKRTAQVSSSHSFKAPFELWRWFSAALLFSPFSLLHSRHLSTCLIAFLLICLLLFCWLTQQSEIAMS